MSSNIEVKLDVLNQKGSPALFADSLASRPAASFAGRLFVDTDNPSTGIYRDTGTTWIQVADETGTIPTPTLQTVTTAGNTSNVGIAISANGIGIGTTIPASNRLDVHSASGLQATFNGTGVTNAGVQLQSAGVGKWTIQNNYNSAANDFVLTDVASSVNRLTITNTGVGTLTASLSATKTATYSSGGTYGIYGNDNYTIPAATSFGSGGLIFASLQGIQNFTYGGNATYDNSALNGSVVGINQIQFSSTGTITMTQATGVRAMTAGIFQNQFLGTTNGTITHLAGIEILGIYKASTGIATITNAYGLLINNLDDYTSGFAFTNRWAIYQQGSSDNNYFAGKVNIGTTTIGTSILSVVGNATINGVCYVQQGFRMQGGYSQFDASIMIGSAVQSGNTWEWRASAAGDATGLLNYWYFPNRFGAQAGGNCIFFNMAMTLVNANIAQTFRGFYYNPNVASIVANTPHTAFENTSGNILLGTTSGSVGIGATSTINASSILQVTSTTQGFLPPRMTTAQKNAIATPATGLVVYDTTLNKLALYTGAGWETVTSI
jgi:hypothetical protein